MKKSTLIKTIIYNLKKNTMKKTYFLINATLILLFSTANAQIVYFDINPDVTTTLNPMTGFVNSVVSIDFNGDGTEEYNFRWDDMGDFGGWFMHMTPSVGANLFNLKGTATNSFGGRYIDPMTSSTSIGSSLNWGTSGPEPFIGDSEDSNFQGLGDRYIGCRFVLGANTHYGWVRVSFDANKTLIVKDYAYEGTPDTAINAGQQTTLSVNVSNFEKNISIYPNPATDFITVNYEFQKYNTGIAIYDLSGRLIRLTTLSNNNNIIDVSKLKGVYIVNLIDEYGKKNGYRKLIVE